MDWELLRERHRALIAFARKYWPAGVVIAFVLVLTASLWWAFTGGRTRTVINREPEPTRFVLRSTSFRDSGRMPSLYAADGANASPPLEFVNVPVQARELALVAEVVDGPVLWVIYKVPVSSSGLYEGVPTDEALTNPPGAMQGRNAEGGVGYVGPRPKPDQTVRLRFTLYALSAPVDLPPGARAEDLRAAMQAKIIEEAELRASYRRE